MHGPALLVRSLARPSTTDEYGNVWRYHSRSDRHSKVACWGILFDLLLTSPTLRERAASGEIVFGINHEMRDFTVNRKKRLDLVVCTPSRESSKKTLGDLVKDWNIDLTAEERKAFEKLPSFHMGGVGSVQIALEAKACMTAHVKALPRLYDELNSSHLTVHGAMDVAIAIGFVMINFSETFVSSDRNKHDLKLLPPKVTRHRQPASAERAVAKVMEIRRRTQPGEEGFDALAIVGIDCANDDSPVHLVDAPPAPSPRDIVHYEQMIRRVAQLYETRFRRG